MLLLSILVTVSSKTSSERRHRRHSSGEYVDEDGDDDDDDDADYSDDVAPPPPPPRPALQEMTDEEKSVFWQNPEHPERRQGRYSGVGDDEQAEFVRTEYTDQEYKKLRTYSTGSVPRQVECYSCMSLSYQTSWKYLQATYIYPKVFTDRCRDPNSERGMPTVMCSTVCVSLMEPDVEAGVFIGFKHIRGCLDRILRHGFNQSALRTHRFHQNNHCRTLSRSALFNPARATDPPALGDVQLCSCYGDRCNSSATTLAVFLTILVAIFFVNRTLFCS
uniref:Uncharacterized protein n=1 Tax=Caenorhabditis japonica TaxID=281687 RepID=A0A8R1DKE2_CAEJA